MFSEELGVKIKDDDLERSHRLGKPKKKTISLEGKRLLITEIMTSLQIQLSGEAQKKIWHNEFLDI